MKIGNLKRHHCTLNELVEESERLEALLEKGEITPQQGRELNKIRAEIEWLEIVKWGV